MLFAYKYSITVCVLILFLSACVKPNDPSKDDKLSLGKRPYTGNQLKVNGFYYYIFENKIYDIHLFYKNGVVADYGSGLNSMDFNKVAEYLGKANETVQRTKYSWGLFLVEGNDIKMEQWHPSSGGPFPAYVRAGKIINDTTFHILESYRMKEGQKTDVTALNEVYYFHEFSPKPDSTNNYIQ